MDQFLVPADSVTLDPQRMWANILAICCSFLFALFLLTLAVGWARHFSRLVRLVALLSLAVSSGAAIVALHLYNTYASWMAFLHVWLGGSHSPPSVAEVFDEIVSANQQATALGWVGVMATGILLVLGLVGIRSVLMPGQKRQLPAASATTS